MNIPKPKRDLPDTSNNKDELSEHQIIRGVLLDLAQSLINGGGLQQGDTLGKMHFDAATERITRYYATHIEIERLEASEATGKHILHHIMPNNDEVESYDRADCLDTFSDIQGYVDELTAALKAAGEE